MVNNFSHYFVDDKTKQHKDISFDFVFKGQKYHFKTQDGVFSKSQIDDGSLFLVETALKQNLNGCGLDLGCGYGAISVLVASNANVNMTACDINERAVQLANENFQANKINANAIISNVGDSVQKNDYDFVITNPPIRVGNAILFKFFEDSYQKLRVGGAFYAVLRKKQGAETYIKKIKSIYDNCEILDKHKGYVIIKSIKK